MERIVGLKPFIFASSKLLILGSMPSVRSLEEGFYYAHPQNRLWKIIASLDNCSDYGSVEVRQRLALKLNLAFFDVIASCERNGSLDSSIKNAVPNDLASLLYSFPNIKIIVTNGMLAKKLFLKYDAKVAIRLGIKVYHLPSTSPANASCSLEKLKSSYVPILKQASSL